MKRRQIIWKSLTNEGLEHIYLREQSRLVQVVGNYVGVIEQDGFQLGYVLECNKNYRIRRATLSIFGGKSLLLTNDDHGNWSQGDGKGTTLPQFEGCIDIDITATPFTNTLPIRRVAWEVGQSRVAWEVGQSREFKMLYITVPELTLSVSEQRYPCLEKNDQGSLFRFELMDGSFTVELPVDADGLVLDYPGLFKRLWSSE